MKKLKKRPAPATLPRHSAGLYLALGLFAITVLCGTQCITLPLKEDGTAYSEGEVISAVAGAATVVASAVGAPAWLVWALGAAGTALGIGGGVATKRSLAHKRERINTGKALEEIKLGHPELKTGIIAMLEFYESTGKAQKKFYEKHIENNRTLPDKTPGVPPVAQ